MAVRAIYKLFILCLCILIWYKMGLTSLPPGTRQINRGLFDSVARLVSHIDPRTSNLYIILQEYEGDGLLWRKVAYSAVPCRISMLPYNLVPDTENYKNVPVDPADGSLYNLRSMVRFSSPDKLASFAKANQVTHLLINKGDRDAAAATGLDLKADHMYLVRLEPQRGIFVEVASEPAP